MGGNCSSFGKITCTRRTCKLHAERPEAGIRFYSLLLLAVTTLLQLQQRNCNISSSLYPQYDMWLKYISTQTRHHLKAVSGVWRQSETTFCFCLFALCLPAPFPPHPASLSASLSVSLILASFRGASKNREGKTLWRLVLTLWPHLTQKPSDDSHAHIHSDRSRRCCCPGVTISRTREPAGSMLCACVRLCAPKKRVFFSPQRFRLEEHQRHSLMREVN